MAIDFSDMSRKRRSGRKACVSPNPYMRLLYQLYKFLARRTGAKFHQVVAKRLTTTRRFRACISLSRVSRFMRGREGKIAVVVGPVTNDERAVALPLKEQKLVVAALRFSETARARIEGSGGECLTLDQLAVRAPLGENTVLLRGPTKCREADKHFGPAPGTPGSHTKPYVRAKGRMFERNYGKRYARKN